MAESDEVQPNQFDTPEASATQPSRIKTVNEFVCAVLDILCADDPETTVFRGGGRWSGGVRSLRQSSAAASTSASSASRSSCTRTRNGSFTGWTPRKS